MQRVDLYPMSQKRIHCGGKRGFVNPEGHSTSDNQSLIVGMPVTKTVSEIICIGCHEPLYRHLPSLANDATTPLREMKERAKLLGGETQCESGKGHGTTVTIHVPLAIKDSTRNGQKN